LILHKLEKSGRAHNKLFVSLSVALGLRETLLLTQLFAWHFIGRSTSIKLKKIKGLQTN